MSQKSTNQKLRIIFLTLAAAVSQTPAIAGQHGNEIGVNGSSGLSSSQPGGYGSIYYQHLFPNNMIGGGSIGHGSVLPGIRWYWLSPRFGYRAFLPESDRQIWVQASVEPAFTIPSDGAETPFSYALYGALGVGMNLNARLTAGVDMVGGRVRYYPAYTGESAMLDKNVFILRANLALRF